jgi:hypothetical protein
MYTQEYHYQVRDLTQEEIKSYPGQDDVDIAITIYDEEWNFEGTYYGYRAKSYVNKTKDDMQDNPEFYFVYIENEYVPVK